MVMVVEVVSRKEFSKKIYFFETLFSGGRGGYGGGRGLTLANSFGIPITEFIFIGSYGGGGSYGGRGGSYGQLFSVYPISQILIQIFPKTQEENTIVFKR